MTDHLYTDAEILAKRMPLLDIRYASPEFVNANQDKCSMEAVATYLYPNNVPTRNINRLILKHNIYLRYDENDVCNFPFLNYMDRYDYADWNALAENRHLNDDFIVRHRNLLVCATHLPLDIYAQHPELSYAFDWDKIANRKGITWDDAIKYPEILKNITFDKEIIPIEYILSHLENTSQHRYICANPKIHIDDILTLPINKHWGILTKRKDATLEYILSHKRYKWDIVTIKENPNFSMEFVKKLPFFPWSPFDVSSFVKWDDVVNYPNYKWDRFGLSRNKNISWDIVLNNGWVNWSLEYLSINTFNHKEYNRVGNSFIEHLAYMKLIQYELSAANVFSNYMNRDISEIIMNLISRKSA